jgi:hypothetical protein
LKRGNFFLSPFPWRQKRRKGDLRSWHAEAQDRSWGKLTLVSDFLQEVAVRAVKFLGGETPTAATQMMIN